MKRARIEKTNIKSLCLDNLLEITIFLDNEDCNDLFFVLNALRSPEEKIYCQKNRRILQERINIFKEAFNQFEETWFYTIQENIIVQVIIFDGKNTTTPEMVHEDYLKIVARATEAQKKCCIM